MLRFAIFIFGLGSTIIGASSYFAGLPLPIDCKSVVCNIGTAAITLDIAMMGIGLLLILISMSMTKASS